MCVRAVGSVTNAIHRLEVGGTLGLRGPFGNGFDMSQAEGMDLLFVAGGLGLAPCRSFIQEALKHRDRYRRVTILAGFRSPGEILFRDDLADPGPFDYVLPFIGREPKAPVILSDDGRISSENKTDELESDCPNIFVAGDLCRGRMRQVSIAMGDGMRVALTLAERFA